MGVLHHRRIGQHGVRPNSARDAVSTGDSSDDAEIDRRAAAILEAVRACWRLLSDLDLPDKAIALDKLTDMMTMEQLSHDPAVAKERQH